MTAVAGGRVGRLTRDPALVVFDISPNLNDEDEQALYGHAHQSLAAHGMSV